MGLSFISKVCLNYQSYGKKFIIKSDMNPKQFFLSEEIANF